MAAAVNCFLPTSVTYAGGGKSTINLGNAVSFYDFQSSLNVDVSMSFSIDMFSLTFAAEYARYTQVQRYSQSFYYIESVTLPTAIIQPAGYGTDALNAAGKAAYAKGPQNFRDVCGNRLVQQVHLGATLAAALKINLASYYDSVTFKANIGISWGSIASATAKIAQMVSQYDLSGSFEISAFQLGGDPTQLAKLFNSTRGEPYFVSSCSLSNLNACNGIVDSILNYAANAFPSQIDFKNGTVLGHANATGWTMMDVSEFGLNAGVSVLTSDIIAARTALGDLYKAQQANSTFVKHLLATPFVNSMTADTVRNLRVANTALDANLALLSNTTVDGPLGCYMEPVNCPAIKQNLLAKVTPVDTGFLDQMNRGFIVSSDVATYYCGNLCVGTSDAGLFPADSIDWMYYTRSGSASKTAVHITGNVFSVAIAGHQCPYAHKLEGYDRYEFSACSCDQICPGVITFIVSENPL
jgi:hypothetical protein